MKINIKAGGKTYKVDFKVLPQLKNKGLFVMAKSSKDLDELQAAIINRGAGDDLIGAIILKAIENASSKKVKEGNVGAGTGTTCFGFKGGIGSASRKLSKNLGGYTVGVLVQTNFGGVLQIDGVPVGKELKKLTADKGGQAFHIRQGFYGLTHYNPKAKSQSRRYLKRATKGNQEI